MTPARREPLVTSGPTVAVTLLSLWLAALFALPARLSLGQVATPSVLIGIGLSILWASALLANGTFPGGTQPLRTALLLFGGLLVVGYLVAVSRILTPAEAGAANRTLVNYGSALGVALFTADALTHPADVLALARRLTWCGVFLAALGILHGAGGIELASRIDLPLLTWDRDLALGIERTSFERVVGTATHPIEYGVVLTMVLPFALHLAITDHRGRRTMWSAASAIIGAAALFALSRSAAIGLVITLGATVVAIRAPVLRRRFVLAIVAAAVAVQLVVPGLIRSVRGLFVGLSDDGSVQARVVDYGQIDRYVEDHLWLGRGLGTFLPDQYLLLDNQMLKLLLEIGLIGAASFIALLVVGLLTGRTVRRRATDAALADLARSCQVALAVGLVTCFTFDFLGFTIARSLLFFVLGLLAASWRVGLGPRAVEASSVTGGADEVAAVAR